MSEGVLNEEGATAFQLYLDHVSYRDVLDRGSVHLLDWMGTDLTIVNNAKVSFGNAAKELGEAELGILRFLMKDAHASPFEAPIFRMRVKCPLFVAREWMRHRWGSFNEISGRYAEMKPEWYIPDLEDYRVQEGKPGRYTFAGMNEDDAVEARHLMMDHSQAAYETYQELLSLNLAKEVARMVLPLNLYTEFIWTVNARSLLNFLSLRTADTAQREIQYYAKAVEELFALQLPHTHEYWNEFGRKAI